MDILQETKHMIYEYYKIRSTRHRILCQPPCRRFHSTGLIFEAYSGGCHLRGFSLPGDRIAEWDRFVRTTLAHFLTAKASSECLLCAACKLFEM